MPVRAVKKTAPSFSANSTQRGNTTLMFMSLFALLLAFFIVLVSMSTIEEKKSARIINEVKSVFNDTADADGQLLAVVPQTAAAEEETDVKIRRIFEQRFSFFREETMDRGHTLHLSVPVDEIFATGQNTLLPLANEFIGELILALTAGRKDTRNELEVFLRLPPLSGNNLSNQERLLGLKKDNSRDLAISRSGVMAQAFLAQGMPKQRFGIGLSPENDASRIDFYFNIRDTFRPKLDIFPTSGENGFQPLGR